MADTRELILEAAWDLFAKKGFDCVSVRDVTNAAGVNLASVSYHFGGKDGLIQETVKRCLGPLYTHSVQLLKEAETECSGLANVPLERVMLSWLRPLLLPEEYGGDFEMILRLNARYLTEVDYAVPTPSQKLMSEMYQVFINAIQVHCPHLSAEQIVKQLIFVKGAAFYCSGLGGAVIQLIAGQQVDRFGLDRQTILDEVVICSTSLFAAYG